MKYQIIIQPHGPHKIEASLISRVRLLWFIPIWVEEDNRTGREGYVRDYVAFWKKLYSIPEEGIVDLTEVAS